MSAKHLRCAVLAALLAGGCASRVSDPAAGRGFIFPRDLTVAQGKHVVLPRWPENGKFTWTNRSGPGTGTGYLSVNGSYHAPLTLPSAATVSVEVSGGARTAVINLHVEPGPVERADCLAPGQPEYRDDAGVYIYVEELPNPIVRGTPEYPDAAREAGVQGTVRVRAFVCACGEVSDVEVENSIPLLDQAAIDAVRQWHFVPALTDGEPVAIWVVIPVRFSLN